MEAYALAKVCKNFQTPFISFKYISDGADNNSADDWNENMKELRDYTLKTTSVMRGGKEGQEGLGAFIERRDPKWHVNNEE